MDSSSTTSSINSVLKASITEQKSSDNEPNAKIVKIPKPLERNPKPQRLRGDVVRKDNDGTLHVRTDKGNITLKPDTSQIKIEHGDKIEVRIDAGNPPQSAKISLAQKELQANILPPEVNINSLNINLPTKLSPLELTNGAPIKLELITDQSAIKIVQPFIENINTNLNLVENLPLLTTALLDLENKLSIVITAAAPPKLELQELPNINSNIAQLTDFVSLQKTETQIPLRIVIAQLLSNPASDPVIINKTSAETLPLSVFLEINISDIKQPFPDITHFAVPEEIRAGEITSELVGFTHDKHFPVIKIITQENQENHYYALQTPIEDIPLGTLLSINVTDAAPAQITQNIITTPAPIISITSFKSPEFWGIMQEVQSELTLINPQAAQNFANIIPNAATPIKLAATSLFFLAAIRSGDVQGWIGEKAVETLKRAGKSDLINRLGSEMAGVARTNSDTSTQEWRALTLPLAWQNEIHKAMIHYRKEGNNGSDGAENLGGKTRFIMDLNLSQMGKVQLDGLFVGDKKNPLRLDLILRTENDFSQAMKMEMRQNYKLALDDTSFTGELSFQNKQNNWISITPDTTPEFSKEI